MKITTAAIVIGVAFVLVGILGFFPNPIIADSHDAIFHADAIHSSVHIISGVLFLFFAFSAVGTLPMFMKVFGVVYFLLGVMGLFSVASADTTTRLLGFLHVNGPDNYLHIALGVVIFVASMLRR